MNIRTKKYLTPKQIAHLEKLHKVNGWIGSEGHKAHIKKLNDYQWGKNNGNWKGGRVVEPHGYVNIRVNNTYVKEHRLVMEKKLGRKLGKHELVHHRNQNRQDNRLWNLVLMNRETHGFLHGVLDGTIKTSWYVKFRIKYLRKLK